MYRAVNNFTQGGRYMKRKPVTKKAQVDDKKLLEKYGPLRECERVVSTSKNGKRTLVKLKCGHAKSVGKGTSAARCGACKPGAKTRVKKSSVKTVKKAPVKKVTATKKPVVKREPVKTAEPVAATA
jgi:hypothetical protein